MSPDFDGWRACFFDFGRVIRDKLDRIVNIVEKKMPKVNTI